MKQIWAPWRKTYIQQGIGKSPKRECVFCRIKKSKNKHDHLVIKKTLHSFALLNLYPYTVGHALAIPSKHVRSLTELNQVERLDLINLCCDLQEAIQKAYRPKGFNIGINLGTVGGAGLPKHVHIHVVPRWTGDSNFMSVLGDTRVISDTLASSHQLLTKIIKK